MGAFKNPSELGAADKNPFGMTLEIPPLPKEVQKTSVDPLDKAKGEKLVTRTFFSFGESEESKQQ